jgi:prophage regulatory protein
VSPNLTPFLRLPEVLAIVKVSRITLWQWRRAGQFPAPIRLGPNTIAWRASDVEKWASTRPPA